MKKFLGFVFWAVVLAVAYCSGNLDLEGINPLWSFGRALAGLAVISILIGGRIFFMCRRQQLG
jgi:hypothetical protein